LAAASGHVYYGNSLGSIAPLRGVVIFIGLAACCCTSCYPLFHCCWPTLDNNEMNYVFAGQTLGSSAGNRISMAATQKHRHREIA